MSLSEIQSTLSSIRNATAVTNHENNKDKMGTADLGSDVFLQLMMVQLQNQNPLEPMDNTEFLSQQAMFTQVSSLQEMNEKMTKYGDALINANNSVMASNQLTQAAQMVGKDITATDPDDATQTITGKVDSVTYGADGTISLSVNGKEIPIASISQVANHTESDEEKQFALKEKANTIIDFVLENPKLQALANSFITKLAEQLL